MNGFMLNKIKQLLNLCSKVILMGLVPIILGLTVSHSLSLNLVAQNNLDLPQATGKAETASEKVFEHLDTTQHLVGKNPRRNQSFEEAREKASQKLKGLADKAQNSAENLSPAERLSLENLQGENQNPDYSSLE